MAEHYPVAPTAPGATSRNNLTLECTLRVITDFHDYEVGEGGDVFTLSAGAPNSYSRSVDIKNAKERLGDYVVIVFDGLSPAGLYTLKVKLRNGEQATLFTDVPYEVLSQESDKHDANAVGPK